MLLHQRLQSRISGVIEFLMRSEELLCFAIRDKSSCGGEKLSNDRRELLCLLFRKTSLAKQPAGSIERNSLL